jgi:hypothetical protein
VGLACDSHAPLWRLQTPTVHLPSSPVQLMGVPATQVPSPPQVSTPLHGLPSSHSAWVRHWHIERSNWQPWVGLQVSVVQATLSLHDIAAPAQAPFVQTSVIVQTLPSLHRLPFALGGVEHAPVPGLHVPASWHCEIATHATGLAPVHAPA